MSELITIGGLQMTFTQEPDCMDGGDMQELVVSIQNGGDSDADDFLVLSTERWAIDSPANFAALLDSVLAAKRQLQEKAREIEASERENR